MNKEKRIPVHPGLILKEMYLKTLGLTITEFAADIGVSRKTVSAVVNGRNSITPEMALRLSRALDTTPDFWLNLQNKYELARSEARLKKVIAEITPVVQQLAY